ncbi:MAG: tRNA uridine-5-carboxymethylaminomethyl(34) synthesis GTPase MnmE [Bacilli bacterium]|nr:tRNA uridine-5-carboxymethylaminomethyl(34) synthesis GTPase MnmE [Bacilli bacterium]
MNDTIAAIATAQGVGAIGIIRVSGDKAIEIVSKIYRGKSLSVIKTHTINYGKIMDKDEMIDEVLVSVMRAPKTFTREDVIEINSHGSIASLNKILELLISNGCRLADPGEFTKRAFLNGRIDLTEAEGIMELIESKTEKSLKIAVNQVNGKVSQMIRNLRQLIKEIIANIEVNIDYPEYEDAKVITLNVLKENIQEVEQKIRKILDESKTGQLITTGIKTVIIGKPNVGKSSLLNNLLNEEKAIVTDIAGTTRDIVEGSISIDGILLNIIDTAGIRTTDNIVEKIGVEKSFQQMEKADLVLLVINNNEELTSEDIKTLKQVENKNLITIINKIDLPSKIDYNLLPKENIIKMSVLNKEGIEELKNKIIELFNLEKLATTDLTYLTSSRSIGILNQVMQLIESIKEGIINDIPVDILEIDIKNIWNLLGQIIGETYEEELIEQLFSQFCLGK